MLHKRLSIVWLLLPFWVVGQTPIKTMFYNLLEFPSANPDNRELILRDILDEYQPDIFMVCELEDAAGANLILNESLNYDESRYTRAQFIPNQSGGSDIQQLIYFRQDKFSVETTQVITTDVRDINRYLLKLKTTDADTDPVFLDIYVAHLKSSTGTSNEAERLDMVEEFTQTLGDLNPNSYVLFSGDLNVYSAFEDAYEELLDPTNEIVLVDPIDRAGAWNNNINFQDVHTQSTRVSSGPFGAGAGGGLDDRFDFILMSENMQTDPKMRYVTNTYAAYGNNGNCFNENINNSGCTGTFSQSLRNLLYNMSDHLPVVMTLETNKEFETFSGIDFEASEAALKLKNTVVTETLSFVVSDATQYPIDIAIYNVLGQRIKNHTLFGRGSLEVDVSELASGVYYVKSSISGSTLKFITSR